LIYAIMKKENITKKYSVYTPTIKWSDVLLREAVQSLHNMYFTKFQK